MNQIYEIAFSYYTVFYSYKGKFFDVWPWMMSSSLTGGGFIYFVWIGLPDLGKFNEEPMLFFFNMLYMVVFEGLFIFSFYKLKDTRDKLLTIEYQHYRKEMQLVLAKRNWILAKINKSEGEYLEFVKEIRDIQNLHKIYAGESENWLKFLFKSIYSSESKTRITSYLIFLFSLISLLTLKGIEDISQGKRMNIFCTANHM
ncbi:MAG: hypothetical protein OFPII_11680 [Osedax symbiont Rs1]|nr:MAG: hypothetical protein OFPII_11680 [Osedax symbiont Rs1]